MGPAGPTREGVSVTGRRVPGAQGAGLCRPLPGRTHRRRRPLGIKDLRICVACTAADARPIDDRALSDTSGWLPTAGGCRRVDALHVHRGPAARGIFPSPVIDVGSNAPAGIIRDSYRTGHLRDGRPPSRPAGMPWVSRWGPRLIRSQDPSDGYTVVRRSRECCV